MRLFLGFGALVIAALLGHLGARLILIKLSRLLADQLLVEDELVGALSQVRRSGTPDADHDHLFALLADAVDQGDKIAVAGGQHEFGDIRVGIQRFHCVDAEVHVDAVLDRAAGAAHLAIIVIGRHVHRLDAVGIQGAGDARITIPVGVGAGDNDAAEVFDPIHDHFEVWVGVQLVTDADVDVFEVDKDGDVRSMAVIWHWLCDSLLSDKTADDDRNR